MDQDMLEFANNFHTLITKLGIKDSKLHLVHKYHNFLHKYMKENMEFLYISSVGTGYQYAFKIKQKFNFKWYFGYMNPKQGKITPKLQNKGKI